MKSHSLFRELELGSSALDDSTTFTSTYTFKHIKARLIVNTRYQGMSRVGFEPTPFLELESAP